MKTIAVSKSIAPQKYQYIPSHNPLESEIIQLIKSSGMNNVT